MTETTWNIIIVGVILIAAGIICYAMQHMTYTLTYRDMCELRLDEITHQLNIEYEKIDDEKAIADQRCKELEHSIHYSYLNNDEKAKTRSLLSNIQERQRIRQETLDALAKCMKITGKEQQ